MQTRRNLAPSIVLKDDGVLLHANIETAEGIPVTSLAATTRADIRLIDLVDELSPRKLSGR
ncbi:MAG: hypothetical protein OXU66_05075 [Gammaproteobacteria bacterium]|nr:hypothetical protein [Gammaproteobacteria bacterium]MDD9894810.1 hypothetical protein [Gammaproteobacteria bacterium]MDD9958295.1 hypothetical protein [Gammaproteobacteria bacterium]